SFAKALISPVLGSIATRNSRAGPTAFLAADSNASCTAEVRTSRLMPFSFSQYSRTAKKSAFITVLSERQNPTRGTKKSVSFIFRLWRAGDPAIFTVLANDRYFRKASQAANPGCLRAVLRCSQCSGKVGLRKFLQFRREAINPLHMTQP